MAYEDLAEGVGGFLMGPGPGLAKLFKGKSAKDVAPIIPGAATIEALGGWGGGAPGIGAPLAQQAVGGVGGNYGTMQAPLTDAPQRDQREGDFLVSLGLGALKNAYEATLKKESAVAGTRPPPTAGRMESFRQSMGAPAAQRQQRPQFQQQRPQFQQQQRPQFQQQLQGGNFPLLQGNYQPQMQQGGFQPQSAPPPMYGGFGTAAPQFQQPQFQQPQFQPRPQFQQQGQAPQYGQYGRY